MHLVFWTHGLPDLLWTHVCNMHQGLSSLGDNILRDKIATGVLFDEARQKVLLSACVDLCRAKKKKKAANHTGSCLPSTSPAHSGSSAMVNPLKATCQSWNALFGCRS